MGSLTLDSFHRPVNAELRVNLHKQIYMIWHDLHFDDFDIEFCGSILN